MSVTFAAFFAAFFTMALRPLLVVLSSDDTMSCISCGSS